MRQKSQTVSHKPNEGEGGFTLIELVVVFTLMAILAVFLFLNTPNFLNPLRLNNGVRQIATDLQLVRTKAISQNRKFRALFTVGGTTYTVERRNDADNGWDPHALYGHGTIASAAQPIPLPSGVQIQSANSGGDVIFQPRGTAENATIVIQHSEISATKSIVVSLAGRIRIPLP